MAGRILQMGDIVAAAAEAHRIVDEKEREELEAKMASGDFTLDDFKNMMEKVSKPGLMGRMMSLMPGMGQFKEALESEEAAGGIRQTIGAINSMTAEERKNPKLIDAARRTRIANGAGVQTPVISQLVKQFDVMKPMMQGMAGGSTMDRAKMMQQLQGAMASGDGSLDGMRVKKNTGKRLSNAERAKLRKQREKMKRQIKRSKSK
jgi:signal recognition particle subunit SRP54